MAKGLKNIELEYLDACREIISEGFKVEDRTGVGTKLITNLVLEHSDVSAMFPAFLSKKLAWKSVVGELLWFLEGSTDDARLAAITYGDPTHDTIWTANYKAESWQNRLEERWPGQKDSHFGNTLTYTGKDQYGATFKCAPVRWLGSVYGAQWRSGFGVDQILDVIDRIKKNPADRRLVVSAWNPGSLKDMALPPCHMMFQFNVVGDQIDLAMFQRSGDMFLGVPFNIASYALLLHLVAKECGLRARKLTIMIGNAHIYLNHIKQIEEQLERQNKFKLIEANHFYRNAEIRENVEDPCVKLSINNGSLFKADGDIGYEVGDLTLLNYEPYAAIQGKMAV